MRTYVLVLVLALAQLGGLPVPEGTPWSFDCTDHAALLGAEHHTLRVYRNEVFARHGRTFKSKDLQEHFGKQSWYTPDPSYADSRLTAADTACVARLAAFEKSDYTMWAVELDLGGPTKTDVTLLANDPRLVGTVRGTDPEVLGCKGEDGGSCKATLLVDATAIPLELNWRVVMEPSNAPVPSVGLSSEEWWHAGVYVVDIDAADGKKELVLRNALWGQADPDFTYTVMDGTGAVGEVPALHLHDLHFDGKGTYRLVETTCITDDMREGWGQQETVYSKEGGRYVSGHLKILKIESPYCAG